MLKTIHLHTDVKFIDSTSRFDGVFFENVVIIFGKKGVYKGLYQNSARYLNYNKNDINKAIEICKLADLVVLYDLNGIKSYIANRLPKNIIVIWRFFGHELYKHKDKLNVYSEYTWEIIKHNKKDLFKNELKQSLEKIKSFIKWRTDFNKEFLRSLKRINFFLGLSDEEYFLLKKIWPELPEFLQASIKLKEIIIDEDTISKKDKIIVGNNRSPYNNHLDLIEIINNSQDSKRELFLFPFNYGIETRYSNTVRKVAGGLNQVKLIENFIPFSNYELLFQEAKAFVLNGFRQMALGNIFLSLRNGVKVYLNEKNITMTWLQNEGFLVFSIEDFIKDLDTGNLTLTPEQALGNALQVNKMAKKYSHENFQKDLYKKVVGNNLNSKTVST